MSYLLGAVIIGGLALALLDRETQNQHDRWQSKQSQLRRETAQQRERPQRAMQNSQDYQEYKEYIELHYASVLTANQAFDLYQSAKHVLDSLYKQLKNSGEHIQLLKEQRQKLQGNEREVTHQMLKQQYELHTQLKVAIEGYKTQKDLYLTDVRSLNEATAQLKQHIRLYTGKAGREWYQRLEQRRA